MPVPFPTRLSLIPAGALLPATFKVLMGELYDAIVALTGTDGEAKTARGLLGVAPRATRIDVASVAGAVDLTSSAPDTDDIRITGTSAISSFTVAVGRVLRVTAGGAFSMTNGANLVTQTGANLTCAAGDTFLLRATAANAVEVLCYAKAALIGNSSTNSIAGDVALNNTGTYFTGPSVAQGATGVWLATGSVTLTDTAAAVFYGQLTDGTNIKDSKSVSATAANQIVTMSFSGVFTSPPGNIRILIKDISTANGKILANQTGLAKDSTLTVVRIA